MQGACLYPLTHLTGYSFILLFQKHSRYRLLILVCSPRTWKVEEPIQNYPLPHSDLGTSLGYTRPCLKNCLCISMGFSSQHFPALSLPNQLTLLLESGQGTSPVCVLSDSHEVFQHPEQLKVSTPGATQSFLGYRLQVNLHIFMSCDLLSF